MSSRRPAIATTTAIASNSGPAMYPSNATVTAISAEIAASADQICRTTPVTPGRPRSTIASSAAASAAAIKAATTRSTASEAHSSGTTPTAVSNAIAARLPVRGNRISAPAMASTAAIPEAPASQRSFRESR